jgi:chromate transport protein ChrA
MLMIDVYIFHSMQTIKSDNYECKCAQTSHVSKISQTIIIIIGLQLLMSIISFILMTGTFVPSIMGLVSLIMIVVTGMQIYYIYLMITYLRDLKKNNCTCVNTNVTDVLFYYAWARVALLVLGVITFIMVMYIVRNIAPQPTISASKIKSITNSLNKMSNSKSSKK